MGLTSTYGVGLSRSGEAELVLRRQLYQAPGTARAVLSPPGHGANALQWRPGTPFGDHAQALAGAGRVVVAIDGGGGATWLGSAGLDAMDAAYSRAISARGLAAQTGKVDLHGYSMGAGLCLAWLARNPGKVGAAWLWAPVTDLQAMHGSNAGFAAEIEAAYGGASWAANSAPFDPIRNVATYRGLGVPVTLAHATDDTTVAYSATQAFVRAVADPSIKIRPVASGSHTGLFSQVPTAEVVLAITGQGPGT